MRQHQGAPNMSVCRRHIRDPLTAIVRLVTATRHAPIAAWTHFVVHYNCPLHVLVESRRLLNACGRSAAIAGGREATRTSWTVRGFSMYAITDDPTQPGSRRCTSQVGRPSAS